MQTTKYEPQVSLFSLPDHHYERIYQLYLMEEGVSTMLHWFTGLAVTHKLLLIIIYSLFLFYTDSRLEEDRSVNFPPGHLLAHSFKRNSPPVIGKSSKTMKNLSASRIDSQIIYILVCIFLRSAMMQHRLCNFCEIKAEMNLWINYLLLISMSCFPKR